MSTTTYFDGITTIDELEQSYRKIAFELHPDRNGGTEESTIKFQAMQAEYLQRKEDIVNPKPKPVEARKFKRKMTIKATPKQKAKIVKHGSKFVGAVAETFVANALGNIFGK